MCRFIIFFKTRRHNEYFILPEKASVENLENQSESSDEKPESLEMQVELKDVHCEDKGRDEIFDEFFTKWTFS